MSIPATHSARISQHVYADPDDPVPFREGAILEIDVDGRKAKYEILKIVEDPLTGYQGAIYQDQASGVLIPAHRGTETSLITPLLKDGAVDAQMVLARANAQTPYAEALTQEAIRMAKDPEQWPDGITSPPAFSHTGHSLGGCHAQNEAAKHGHGGASFNAFGAAGIGFAPAGIVERRHRRALPAFHQQLCGRRADEPRQSPSLSRPPAAVRTDEGTARRVRNC